MSDHENDAPEQPANDNRNMRRVDAAAADLGWSSAQAFFKWCLREGVYMEERGRIKFVDLNDLRRGAKPITAGKGRGPAPPRRSTESELDDAVQDTIRNTRRRAQRG